VTERPDASAEPAGEPASTWEIVQRIGHDLWIQAHRSPTEAVRSFLSETIWQWELSELPAIQRWIVQVLRILYLVGRGFVSSRAQQQAMALTYTTMLALVPAFAILVAMFSVRGLHQARGRLEGFLIDAIAASPTQRQTLATWLNDLSENLTESGGVAGAAFLVFLFFTIVALLGTLERTMNDIWNIKRTRGFISKFVTYWCIATLGPILLGIALVQGTSLEYRLWEGVDDVRRYATETKEKAAKKVKTSKTDEVAKTAEPEIDDAPLFGGAGGALAAEFELEKASTTSETKEAPSLESVTKGTRSDSGEGGFSLVSLFLTVITFTLLYAFLPNTQVKLKPALVGALAATLLWGLTRWGLTLSSATLVKYNTVYGSLATIPITMFWLYLSWLIVILGAELTFALQNLRTQRKEELATETTALFKETVALRMCAAIASAFEAGLAPPDLEDLSELTGAPVNLCSSLLFHLTQDGLLRESEASEGRRGYVPARPLDKISISDIVDSLRERRGISFELAHGDDLEVVQHHLDQANAASKALSSRTTLRRVVLQLAEERQDLAEQNPVTPETAATAATTAQAILRIATHSGISRPEPSAPPEHQFPTPTPDAASAPAEAPSSDSPDAEAPAADALDPRSGPPTTCDESPSS
jgi:uncharacterized BrkB/YihY/UPF0761 family membrane protein/DNA-binding IscR family transcriptional regulator